MTTLHSVNLANMTFFEVKKLAKAISGKTNEDLAEEIGMGHEHVARHFREANYNISPAMMPHLCKSMGNDLQIEWQVVQVGAYLAKVDRCRREDLNIDMQMAKVCRESAEVMEAWASALMDGSISHQEKDEIDLALIKLIRKADECRTALRVSKMDVRRG